MRINNVSHEFFAVAWRNAWISSFITNTKKNTLFSPFQETFFYTESTTVNSNLTNHQSKNFDIFSPSNVSYIQLDSSNSPAPVIVTRTLSTSNVRNASSTIVQTTPTNCPPPSSSSIPLPHLHPRTSSPSIGVISSYHPITTELWRKENI